MAAFEQDGFCMFDCFLRPTHLEELRHAFDERMKAPLADDCEVDLGVNWASPDAEPFLRALRDERLLDFLAELCGPNFVAMRLELFEKRPGSLNLIPWHQDTYTTHVGFSWDDATASAGQRPHPVTLWVALDIASSETGGMEMVPGRHRELLGAAVPQLAILDAAAHGHAVEYKLLPGQAGVHHPLTPHRSMPNSSPHRRRAFLVRFVPWSDAVAATCDTAASDLAWHSEPSGKYCWRPANAAAVAPGRALNRLLVCSSREPREP